MNRRIFLLGAAALSLTGSVAPAGLRKSAAGQLDFIPTRFTVITRGSGPDVILIPGLTASREVWSATVAALPGYRYHLVQIAGFAGLPAGPNARGAIIAPVAQELARYISSRRLHQPALVGHSMGGTLAMMVAARYPSLIGKTMVVDMLPEPAGLLGYDAASVRGLATLLENLGASPGGRTLIESMIGFFGGQRASATRSDADVVARATHELALIDLRPELPKIRAPLTVLYAAPDAASRGAADRIYAAAYAGRKGTRLIRVDNSGHLIMQDQPIRFRELLKGFLD